MRTVSQSTRIFDGVSLEYDAFRLATPRRVPDLLTQILGRRPGLVVDLGAGTGLSTFVWEASADRIIGIEPNAEMRAIAASKARGKDRVEFRKGDSGCTGIPEGGVDIVVSTSALHWMDPEVTLPEVARILRRDGVFAGLTEIGCPTVHPALEVTYQEVAAAASRLGRERKLWREVPIWYLDDYLECVTKSGYFAYTKEILFHEEIVRSAEQFVGWVRSVGAVRGALREGITEGEIGLPGLEKMSQVLIGETSRWHISYRMIVGARAVQEVRA